MINPSVHTCIECACNLSYNQHIFLYNADKTNHFSVNDTASGVDSMKETHAILYMNSQVI